MRNRAAVKRRERSTLLPQLGLSSLDGGHNHITDTGGGQAVQASTDSLDGNDVQVLGASVVCTVNCGSHGQTQGHGKLGNLAGSLCRKRDELMARWESEQKLEQLDAAKVAILLNCLTRFGHSLGVRACSKGVCLCKPLKVFTCDS